MSFSLTTSQAIIAKAGAGASVDATTSGGLMAEWCDQAEADLATLTRKDWVTDLSSINVNFRKTLSSTVAGMAAMNVISYDSNGYKTREAELKLDVLRDMINRNLDALKDEKHKEVMV